MMKLTTEQYFQGVPARYRDSDRFTVQRKVKLQWLGGSSKQEIKVYEVSMGSLVWAEQEAAQ